MHAPIYMFPLLSKFWIGFFISLIFLRSNTYLLMIYFIRMEKNIFTTISKRRTSTNAHLEHWLTLPLKFPSDSLGQSLSEHPPPNFSLSLSCELSCNPPGQSPLSLAEFQRSIGCYKPPFSGLVMALYFTKLVRKRSCAPTLSNVQPIMRRP